MCEIKIDRENKTFLLSNDRFSYAVGVNSFGFPINLHWGGKLSRVEDLPDADCLQTFRHRLRGRSAATLQEYPGWGGELYSEPALKITFANGARNCILTYKRHEEQENSEARILILTLADKHFPIEARLFYKLYKSCDILERWSEISNNGSEKVIICSAMSANFNLPRTNSDYRLSYLSGRWGRESTIERQQIKQGKILLENRTGLSGPFAVPFFAIDDGKADEDSGRVWFGSLKWSGNWKIAVERDAYDQVNVCGGINDFDFSWPLSPKETFVTPAFSFGISDNGFGEMSRLLHDYQMKNILPRKIMKKPMPLLFNSWGSLGLDIDEEKILRTAEKAAQVGAELFVIDDGWQAALGDWTPDTQKFPNGLKPIIEKVKDLGMNFGLWVEVESFEIASELYKQHPNWAMTYPEQEPLKNERADIERTSMMLNFAKREVAEYIYNSLHNLVKETGISYLKLDMNCYFVTPGWEDTDLGKQQSIWVEYVKNLYGIFRRLHCDFPELMIENCASGAGRADLGMSEFSSRINRSDNQDSLDIMKLHEGFTWLHPSRLAGGACHISDSMQHVNTRKTPLQFQAFAGMLGSLAVGKNLLECSQEELQQIREFGDLHKKLRHITQFGDLYRLASHYENPYAAFEFVSKDKSEAVLILLGHGLQFAENIPNIRLQGLDEDRLYSVEIYGEDQKAPTVPNTERYKNISGKGLMELGLKIEILGDCAGRLLVIRSK